MGENPNWGYNPMGGGGRGLPGSGVPRDGNVKPQSPGNTDKPAPGQPKPIVKPWPSLQPDLDPSTGGDGDGGDDGKGPDKPSPATPKEDTKPGQDEGDKRPDDKPAPQPGQPTGGKKPPATP